MPEEKEEHKFSIPLNALAHNVSIKIKDNKPEAIIRSLDTKFCTIVTVKTLGNDLILFDFGHPDVILTAGQGPGAEIDFREFEFSPSASIAMPLDAAKQLRDNLDKAILAMKAEGGNESV